MAATLPEWTKGADLNDWAAEHGGLPHIYRIIDGMSNGALQRLIADKQYPKRLLKHARETLSARGVAEEAVEEVTPATAKTTAAKGKATEVGHVRQKIREWKAAREAAGEAPPARTPSRAPAKAPAKARKEPTAAKEQHPGRPYFGTSKAELYDLVETGSKAEVKAAQKELRTRNHPVTRPTGAMKGVIKGELPRQRARIGEWPTADLLRELDATIPERVEKDIRAELRRRIEGGEDVDAAIKAREREPRTLPSDREETLSQKARREIAREDQEWNPETWGDMVGQDVVLHLDDGTEETGVLEPMTDPSVVKLHRGGDRVFTIPAGRVDDIEPQSTMTESEEAAAGAPPMTEFERRYGTQEERVARSKGPAPAKAEQDPRDALIAKLRAKLAEVQGVQEAPAAPAAAPAERKLTSMTGAQLRELADSGDQAALQEIERRAAKREAAGKPPLGGAKRSEERLKGTAEDTRPYVMEGEEGAPIRARREPTYPVATGEENLAENLDWRGLDELGDYSHKPGQVVYGKLNGDWVHIIPTSVNREDGSVDVKMAGQGENAERFRITPEDDFRFIAPVENESGQEPTRELPSRMGDQYNPPMTEGERLLREETIRARAEEPMTREEELGLAPRPTAEPSQERIARRQRGTRELEQMFEDWLREGIRRGYRREELVRYAKEKGWQDITVADIGQRAESDIYNRNRLARLEGRQTEERSNAVESYYTWLGMEPNMPESKRDQVWRAELERSGWTGRTIPPRPDIEDAGYDRFGQPREPGKGGATSQMTALENQPFGPGSRYADYPTPRMRDPDEERALSERAGEYGLEATGSAQFEDIARQALIDALRRGRDLRPGEGTVGVEPQIRNPEGHDEAVGLGSPPFSNFAPLPEGEQGLGGTALPGMAPGERARLKGLVEGGGAPAPARLERQLPGFAAGAEPSAVPPTTVAPEDLRNALQSATSQVGGGGGPLQDVGEFLYRNTLENIVNLFANGGAQPSTPGVPVPGGVPAPVPAVAGFGAPGLDQMMLEALRDPANRPVYGLTSQGPIPMNTQGGMEQAARAFGILLGALLPGYQQTLEG